MQKPKPTLLNYIRENGWEMLSGLIISVVGFFFALYIDSLRERKLQLESYLSMLEAVRQEAVYNKNVLTQSFEPFFETDFVATNLSLSTVKASLANSIFIHHSGQETFHLLNEYMRELDLSNGFATTTRSLRTVRNEVDAHIIEEWRKNIGECKAIIQKVEIMNEGKLGD